jgi:predicted HTH domain antitoxin
MIRTNIMLTPQQHALLKEQSRLSHRTIGELVRDAVNVAFLQDTIERRRQVALAAYQEGFISLGKLAETLGLDTVSTRHYLREQAITPAVQEASEILADVVNA